MVHCRFSCLADCRGGGSDVYRVGILAEALFTDHHSRRYPPRVGALLALMIAGSELDEIAIIGIILLIGIVKKNAIMMIDFALAASAKAYRRAKLFTRLVCCVSSDLMTTLAALAVRCR